MIAAETMSTGLPDEFLPSYEQLSFSVSITIILI
jgi:hypothetical protein